MERFTLNGLISDTVREAVNLTNQLNCLLELGSSIEDGIFVNSMENRTALVQAREALWSVERAVRGCDVVTSTERTGTALRALIVNLLEEMGAPSLQSVAEIVNSKIDSIDFEEHVTASLHGVDWSKYGLVTTYRLEDWMSDYLNGVDWSDYDVASTYSLDGYITEYLSGVDWSEYNLVTEDEVDSKIEDLCDEDKVHDIASTMISSLEVVIRRNF